MRDKNINLSDIDVYILNLIGKPQNGFINFGNTTLTKFDFLYKLTTSKAALETITLIPSETNYFFLFEISQKLNLSFDKLLEAYNKYTNYPDGVIFADTYRVPVGIEEDELMRILITNSLAVHRELSFNYLGEWDEQKWFEYITIASIIEKEAGNESEKPLISAVIHNRLKNKMKLQMDGTLNYGKFSHTKVTPQRIKEDNSTFNTYKINGLPLVPISSVTFSSIDSAILPAKVDYLYFVRDSKDTHIFTKNYKEHLNNLNKY